MVVRGLPEGQEEVILFMGSRHVSKKKWRDHLVSRPRSGVKIYLLRKNSCEEGQE